MENTQNVFKFSSDLMKAYRDYYEKEIGSMSDEEVQNMILNHSHVDRLQIYLEANGIIGYTKRIYEIATGGF